MRIFWFLSINWKQLLSLVFFCLFVFLWGGVSLLIYSRSSEDFDKRQMSIRVHMSINEYKSIEF